MDSLTEVDSGPRGGKIIWGDALEDSFKELNFMVSYETLLNYLYWKIPFTVHTDAYDKQLSAVISQNNKPIKFLSRILSKPKCKYTKIEKVLILVV